MTQEEQVFDIDADPDNTDWLRQHWPYDDIKDIPTLKKYLVAWGVTPEEFKQWPLYKNCVKLPDTAWLKDL